MSPFADCRTARRMPRSPSCRKRIKIIDMSADFRLRDPKLYAEWYANEHSAPELIKAAVYGLTEHYRDKITHSAAGGLSRLLSDRRAARAAAARQGEADRERGHHHRRQVGRLRRRAHAQAEHSVLAKRARGSRLTASAITAMCRRSSRSLAWPPAAAVTVNFTPHLVPMSPRRALHLLCPACRQGVSREICAQALAKTYADSPFVRVVAEGVIPATQHVRGSNFCHIGVFADRISGRAIVISAIDNLVKGSAGQALQNFNLMYGFAETHGPRAAAALPLTAPRDATNPGSSRKSRAHPRSPATVRPMDRGREPWAPNRRQASSPNRATRSQPPHAQSPSSLRASSDLPPDQN